jgi:hypothetical protein
MRVLIGVTDYGDAKGYIMPSFLQMLAAIRRRSLHDVHIAWAGNAAPMPVEWELIGTPGLTYADDMLRESREWFMTLAPSYGRVVWQGVDALYQSVEDFDKLVAGGAVADVVAPLICARADEGFAIARRFVDSTKVQYDIPDEELCSGRIVPSGFAGADNFFISPSAYSVEVQDYVPWYVKVNNGKPNTCYEEDWVWQALLEGKSVMLDTSVPVWHVHEDNIARMYPGIRQPLSELPWN